MHLRSSLTKNGRRRGPVRRAFRTMLDYLPRGNTLDDESFRRRHLLMCWVLGLHIPALFAFGIWQGYGVRHSAIEIATPTACLAFARVARNRRLAAFFVTAGLVFCSSVLVHLSGGTIEAHFHFFILIGLIALYQDWVPFLWNVIFTVLSHGLGSSIAADLMFNHDAAQNRPWSWAAIHGVSVLAACIGVIIFWKNTEIEQHRSNRLASELAASELAAAQTQAAQRQSISDLFVNLARRNQSLLDRQLALISELEQQENKPEALSDLFQLDHLATRIRRNAESLLVLSGDEPPRLWGRPVPLSEVVRAAAAEVEDYPRVEVLVSDYLEVSGRVVADLSHLLAELIENATMFSPPTSGVRVRTHLVPGEGRTFLLSIEDTGIGLSDEQMQAANELLAKPPDLDPRRSTLGFHVVGRLAIRLGLRVNLAHTPGGGVTALVTLPPDVVSERRLPAYDVAPPAFATSALDGAGPYDGGPWVVQNHNLARASLAPRSVVAVADPTASAVAPPAPPFAATAPPYAAPITTFETPAPPYAAPITAFETPAPPYAAPITAFETPAPPYATPAPPYETPAPPYATPAPPYETPAPPYAAPAPPYETPAPPYAAPAPPYETPAPPYATPAPPYETPAPPYATPAPPYETPAPPYAAPAPPYETPAPPYATPAPPFEAPDRSFEAPPAPQPGPPFEAPPAAQPGPPFEAPAPQPASPGAAPDPAPAAPTPSAMTADGLVRRVPGASLAPSLRKTSGGDGEAQVSAGGTTPADWRPGGQAGSMLSRFQANQRAGRAAAAASPPVDIETHPGEDGP
jgi:signal transduction histidine kinase